MLCPLGAAPSVLAPWGVSIPSQSPRPTPRTTLWLPFVPKQPDSPISTSLPTGFWRQKPALGVSSYSRRLRGKYKNGVGNLAVTKEGNVPAAVGVAGISLRQLCDAGDNGPPAAVSGLGR